VTLFDRTLPTVWASVRMVLSLLDRLEVRERAIGQYKGLLEQQSFLDGWERT